MATLTAVATSERQFKIKTASGGVCYMRCSNGQERAAWLDCIQVCSWLTCMQHGWW